MTTDLDRSAAIRALSCPGFPADCGLGFPVPTVSMPIECAKRIEAVAGAISDARTEAYKHAAEMAENESHRPGAQGYSGEPKAADFRRFAKTIRVQCLGEGGQS